jgi:formyl-CoA transferase
VRLLGHPVKLSRTPADPTRPAPALGEHTEELLRDAGLGEEQIAELLESGAAAGPAAEATEARFMA